MAKKKRAKKQAAIDPRLVKLTNAAEWLLAVMDSRQTLRKELAFLHRAIHGLLEMSSPDDEDTSTTSSSSTSP